MDQFIGCYWWDGKKHSTEEPIAWFPGAYNLKIVNLSGEKKGVQHLKPYLCVYSKTGMGLSISERPEKFAEDVCRFFNLDIEKILWAEEEEDGGGDIDIVVFNQTRKVGGKNFYHASKRKPLSGEKRLIEKELGALNFTA